MKKALAIGLLSIGLILTGVYGVRAVKTYLIIRNAENSVENPVVLKRWMTIPYLSKTYRIPEAYLYKTLNVPVEGNDNRNLRYIRKNYYKGDLKTMLVTVQTAIASYRTGKPNHGF